MKKLKLNKYVMLLLFLPVIFLSCKKYLEEKSDKSLVVPASLKDLQGVLDDNPIMNSRTTGFGEVYADDYFITPANYNSFGDFDRKSYAWNVKQYNFPNDWANSYLAVYNANYCLENLPGNERTIQNQLQWDNIKGSALFYRAYYFLSLAWDFAKAYDSSTAQTDPGIVLRLTSDFNVPSVRATVKETYEQIINDLMEANNYLPDNPVHPIRPSKAASYAALARAYLSMRSYDSAYKYADLCLNIKSDLLDYNDPEIDPAANVPFRAFNKEIIFYSTQSGAYSTTFPPSCSIDTVLYASYDDNDKRKTVFFRPFNGYHRFKGNYSAATNTLFSGIATDEMFLVKAECLARRGNADEAMNTLNTLLEKRWVTGTFVPFTAATGVEALDIILQERRKELLMRCLRLIDIKRLNKEGRNITPVRIIEGQTYTLPPNDSRYALPLPQDIINETGMPQN